MFTNILVRFAQKHAVVVVAAAFLITAGFGFFAARIGYDANLINLLPRNEDAVSSGHVEEGQSDYEHIILFVESDNLFTLDGLRSLETTIGQILDLPEVTGAVTPFNFFTFRTDNGSLKIVPMSPGGRAPADAESLAAFRESITEEPLARNLVISNDLSALGTVFFIERSANYSPFIAEVESLAKKLEPVFEIHLAGRITVIEAAKRNLMRDVPRFFIPGILLILVIFFLGFKTGRSVFLPLAAVVMGTVWTLGVMSLSGLRLSVVSIMVPPLVLALGSSYSIHILHQYYGTTPDRAVDKSWIAGSIAGINRTIVLAAATSIIGFLSLLTAVVPQIREFGFATGLGIVFCVLLSLLFMPAALSLMRNPKTKERRRILKGALLKFMDGLSSRIINWRYIILGLLAVIIALFIFSIPGIRYQTDYTSYQRRSTSAIDDYLYSTRKFGGFVFAYITLTAPEDRRNFFLQPDNLKPVARFEEELRRDGDIAYIASFSTYLTRLNNVLSGQGGIPESRAPILLLSRYFKSLSGKSEAGTLLETFHNSDFSRLTISLRIYDGEQNKPINEVKMNELLRRIRSAMERDLDPETRPQLWGDSLAYLSISEILSRDQLKSVAVSVLLVLLVTLIAFRSFKFGFLALVPMLMGIMLTIIVMNLLKIPFDVVTVMFTSVAIGVGIDDSIHFILQYRRNGSIRETMRAAGRPILLTSAALVGGLMVLSLSGFLPIVYFGILISLVLVATTAGALIVLPALLAIFA